jgi:exosortase
MPKNSLLFTIFSAVVFAVFISSVINALNTPLATDNYSHILFIPLISACLLYEKRRALQKPVEVSHKPGSAMIITGVIIYVVDLIYSDTFTVNQSLSLIGLSAVMSWTGVFAYCYGIKAMRVAIVPFAFLVFIFPIPTSVMDKFVYLLQAGSSYTVECFLTLTGVPFTRDGFIFHLPTLSVEVAKQCSGIRSTLALIITSVLASHILLRNYWQKSIFLVSIVPIAIFKNGLRITVLSILGVYLDERILVDGWLHRSGGIVFFIIALCLLSLVLILLRSAEKFTSHGRTNVGHSSTASQPQ